MKIEEKIRKLDGCADLLDDIWQQCVDLSEEDEDALYKAIAEIKSLRDQLVRS